MPFFFFFALPLFLPLQAKLPIWRAVIQKRRLFERVKRDVGIVVNCTTQYVQNLNHMFRTKANDRRASRVSRNNQEAGDL
ncbi:hypothetical protein M431DRAFT_404521 [Trichoderma harzianum CBS 226.95]|uniref:Secreted protein n=1 Tax=Trichoderma harzianum CBS 226.95 TaxID=983964 RepID=A0A2T4AF03_TRIHA|nr:hypothetical protein M431DRAFT_404521 [Trichoderma harzianum CBS 226.95]PTB55592.1 hypothetical protein M431DRAFT_404521 [Trichoderma harzianum CBS 226.95]